MIWSPIKIVRHFFKHKDLIFQFTKRDILGRFKGSYLGLVWALLTPLLMLVIYTFVFSVVFKSRWGDFQQSNTEFALILFCGITTFNVFSEVVTRAPSIIVGNVNYVKKVVFPLEILPLTSMGTALVNASISYLILLIGLLGFLGTIQWTIIFLPIVLLPLIFLALGLSWIISSLGVFLRDIGQIVSIGITAVMFLSPIFYPVDSVPEKFRGMYDLNPLGYVIEETRQIMVMGHMPNWKLIIIGNILCAIFAYLGYIWFSKTKVGFADVL